MPYATNNGVRIYYEREGSGPPLILQQGFSLSLERWRETGFVAALNGDYELILMDPCGHGGSDKPHDPAAYTLDTRVGDVLAVLDDARVDEQAIFWGYSMGGQVGYGIARYAPARFRALIVGGAHSDGVSHEWSRQVAEGLRSGGITAYVEGFVRNNGVTDPAFRSRLLANDAEALAACVLAMGDQPSCTASLQHLTIPMLVYVGERDSFYGGVAEVTAGLPHVTFVPLPGFTHGEASRRSDVVLPHVRAFLANVDSAAGVQA